MMLHALGGDIFVLAVVGQIAGEEHQIRPLRQID